MLWMQKQGGWWDVGDVEDLGGIGRGETVNRIYFMKKKLFSIKEKQKK